MAFATLMGGLFLIFVGQWPGIARRAHLDDSVPFEALVGASMLAILFIYPLVAYILAIVVQLVLKLIRSERQGLFVRYAIFWAMLAASPLWMAQGLLQIFVGQGIFTELSEFVAFFAFVGIAMLGLRSLPTTHEAS